MLRLRARGESFALPSAKLSLRRCGGTKDGGPLIRPLRGHLQLCTPQCEHWGVLKGKANEDASFNDISLVNGWYADLLCQHLDIPVAFRDTFW